MKGTVSKVKPGMQIVDDAHMNLALRMQTKVEYLDFNRIHRETNEMKKRCQTAQAKVDTNKNPATMPSQNN